MPALLAVHAHPDDESLTMAATLAGAVAAGVRVTLVTATLGEQGEVIGHELQGLVADRADQLGGYRYTELRAAASALGVADWRLLGGVGAWRDSGMAGTPSAAHPRAFVRARPGGPDHDLAVAALLAVLDEVAPDVVLTYAADGGYGHPDHIATHEVTAAAFAQWTADGTRSARLLAVARPREAFTAALADLTVPAGFTRVPADDLGFLVDDAAVDVAVPVGPHAAAARAAALRAHATQVTVFGGDPHLEVTARLPDGFVLSNKRVQPLLPYESFQLLAGPAYPAGERPATDLFSGSDSADGPGRIHR